jgi:DNA-binding transcriptional LysR family regulator
MKPPLDSRQLYAFVRLAHNGSFTQTARDLFLTQSAISHSMRALEEDIGCRLFDRLGKKITLTQAGEHLLQHAERVLNEMHVARDGIEALGKWGRSRLRLGSPASLCAGLLPPVIRSFKNEFPRCDIRIEGGHAHGVIRLLEEGRVDLALTVELPADERFEFLPLFTDELAFLVSPEHPWSQNSFAPRAEIPKQQFIVYDKSSRTWQLIDEYFREDGHSLNAPIELGSMSAIKELVKLNLGVSVLTPWVATRELAEGSLVSVALGRRKLKRQWGVIHWRGRRMSLAEETLIRLCRAAAVELLAPHVAPELAQV